MADWFVATTTYFYDDYDPPLEDWDYLGDHPTLAEALRALGPETWADIRLLGPNAYGGAFVDLARLARYAGHPVDPRDADAAYDALDDDAKANLTVYILSSCVSDAVRAVAKRRHG